jgi:hypothetical protein
MSALRQKQTPTFRLFVREMRGRATHTRNGEAGWWAHKDSNLGPAD